MRVAAAQIALGAKFLNRELPPHLFSQAQGHDLVGGTCQTHLSTKLSVRPLAVENDPPTRTIGSILGLGVAHRSFVPCDPLVRGLLVLVVLVC